MVRTAESFIHSNKYENDILVFLFVIIITVSCTNAYNINAYASRLLYLLLTTVFSLPLYVAFSLVFSYVNYTSSDFVLFSPNGQQFMSCKEVSSYLLPYVRPQEVSQPVASQIDENTHRTCNMVTGSVSSLHFRFTWSYLTPFP